MARQAVAVEAGDGLELLRGDGPVEVLVQEGAGALHGRRAGGRRRPARRRTIRGAQGPGDGRQRVVALKRLKVALKVVEHQAKRGQQARIGPHGLGDEGQGRGRVSQGLQDQSRLHIEHAVSEAVLAPRPSVMGFIGVKDDDMAVLAVAPRPPIVEGLHAAEREAQGVGVMPVGIVGVAGEIGLDALQPGFEVRLAHPVARSFKTGRRLGP